MPKAINVKNIALHCSAGYAGIDAVVKFWKTKWKNPYGYHWFIETDGTIWWLTANGTYSTDETKVDFTKITNGVLGFNDTLINGCYQGGIKNLGTKEKPIYKGVDTRTDEQKRSIDYCIQKSITWLEANGKDITKDLGIVGHRDYSKDGNNNGTIESWERIKECPCFDPIEEYGYFYGSADRYGKLPTQE